jgi:hypothetical protein
MLHQERRLPRQYTLRVRVFPRMLLRASDCLPLAGWRRVILQRGGCCGAWPRRMRRIVDQPALKPRVVQLPGAAREHGIARVVGGDWHHLRPARAKRNAKEITEDNAEDIWG